MPVRNRAGSSPVNDPNSRYNRPPPVISPSRRSAEERLRRGSLGAVDAVKQRARRDTTTSSDMSSENELDPSVFKRRQVKQSRGAQNISFLDDQTEEEGDDEQERLEKVTEDQAEESGNASDGSSLSSEFAETADSESLLDADDDALGPSSLTDLMPPTLNVNPPDSPRRARNLAPNTLQALPPPRPISVIQPISALGQAIRARKAKPKNPVEIFARFSGKGALDPLNIRIYAPFSETPSKPFDLPLQRTVQDSDSGATSNVTVADAIGLCLWRYHEESLKPELPREKLDVNRWSLRIVDDGEVEYDFPALNRVSNIVDFASNNNRSARGRSRGKAYDEFALVEATEGQYMENKRLTPKYTKQFEDFADEPLQPTLITQPQSAAESVLEDGQPLNTVINKPFAFAARKGSATLDQPSVPVVHSTPRVGPPKLLKVHFTSLEAHSQNTTIEVTTDTYIAEVLDIICKRWNLDKVHHFFKVTGTNTVAPLDRTVEVIGARTDLDLVRRRFALAGSLGLASSPSSSSPNAPLLLTSAMPPSKKMKKSTFSGSGGVGAHPLSHQQDVWGTSNAYKKYTVLRKQPMSFAPSHNRTLLMDGEYLHILPGETGKTLFDTSAKTTTVPFSMIVGCKISRRHPKTFRVVVFRDRETKRYDFEGQSASEAEDIVAEIRKGMEPFMAAR